MSFEKFDIRRMAEALQGGAVMMAAHCESCGAPLFRYKDGKIKCVNCGKLYKASRREEGFEELSSLEYSREEAISLLKEIEKRVLDFNDEHELRSIVETLRKVLEKLAGTG